MKQENGIKVAYSKLILEVFGGTPEDLLPIRSEDIGTINKVVAILPHREEKVLRSRFGLETEVGLTLKEISIELGVTRERVRQIEKKALNRLRYPSRLGKCIFFYSTLRQCVETLINENQELRERIGKCEFFISRQEKDWFLSNMAKEQAIRAYPILGSRIDEYEFSVRMYNFMINIGAKTLYDVVVKTEQECLTKKGFGQKSLAEIKEFLSGHGLSLGMKF